MSYGKTWRLPNNDSRRRAYSPPKNGRERAALFVTDLLYTVGIWSWLRIGEHGFGWVNKNFD